MCNACNNVCCGSDEFDGCECDCEYAACNSSVMADDEDYEPEDELSNELDRQELGPRPGMDAWLQK